MKLGKLDVRQSMLHGTQFPCNPPRLKEIFGPISLVKAAYY